MLNGRCDLTNYRFLILDENISYTTLAKLLINISNLRVSSIKNTVKLALSDAIENRDKIIRRIYAENEKMLYCFHTIKNTVTNT